MFIQVLPIPLMDIVDLIFLFLQILLALLLFRLQAVKEVFSTRPGPIIPGIIMLVILVISLTVKVFRFWNIRQMLPMSRSAALISYRIGKVVPINMIHFLFYLPCVQETKMRARWLDPKQEHVLNPDIRWNQRHLMEILLGLFMMFL